jgi:hypothetical protein
MIAILMIDFLRAVELFQYIRKQGVTHTLGRQNDGNQRLFRSFSTVRASALSMPAKIR